MLKSITLENFVHFKDRTVIDFDTTPREKRSKASLHKEATSSNASANKKQRRNAEKEVTASWNTLNIFVGANFCGKSTVLELIRRCMTDEINVSVTNSFDNNSLAYVFCQFNLSPYDEVISGIIKEARNDVMYKVFIYKDKNDTFLRSKSSESNATYNGLVHEADDKEAIHSIVEKKSVNFIQLLHLIKSSNPQKDCLPEEPSWITIERKYVSTLPLRGIGIVQWTRSKKIKKEDNYETACERAEIISAFLSNDYKDNINENDEERNFQFITHPEIFKFEKRGKLIFVQHYKSKEDVGNVRPKEFPLLKTSEGILEAKLTSLLLAHKDIHTLCLEDPDRGMHPQMIERLRTVLYREAYNKTIIVVTHSPYLIDTITVDKTHVFCRTKTKTNSYECSVKNNVGENKELSKVSDIETLRTLFFSTKVLLVEGVSDREVVEGIFTHIKRKALKENAIDDFYEDITTYHVIPVHGCENTKKVQSFCKYINLTCLCLWDLDKVVKFDKETRVIKKFVEIDKRSRITYNDKYSKKKLSVFINKEDSLNVAKLLESKRNTFIWRHGAIEDAILSSNNCDKIRIYLNGKKPFKSKDLKNRLKDRLNEGERKKFYAELLKVDEINRFLKFIKDNEGVENEENEEKQSKPNENIWKHFKTLQYICLFIFAFVILLYSYTNKLLQDNKTNDP